MGPTKMAITALERGANTIKNYVRTLPKKPGVYRMLNKHRHVLYVGKAISLKDRVQSYTQVHALPNRLKRLVAETTAMEFVITASEVEALLLEANFIKRIGPPFNVRLKDDKFFAYIHLSHHPYPRLSKYRGPKDGAGKYFGPFVSAGAIDNSLSTLYKTFQLRSCRDTYFANRTRPCLQYHIKRCSGPCVGYVSQEAYHTQVQHVTRFLKGESLLVQEELAESMYEASQNEDYERAAVYRDQAKALRALQAQQAVNIPGLKDVDFFAIARQGSYAVVQGFFYRNGSNHGTHAFTLSKVLERDTDAALLDHFLLQFYFDKRPPPDVVVNRDLKDTAKVEAALREYRQSAVKISRPQRGPKHDVLQRVSLNAQESLERSLASTRSSRTYVTALAKKLGLPQTPERIEVYDNSHIQGRHAIGSMIVATPEGFDKKAYRKFLIKNTELTPGDDFAMMREVLQRRFSGTLATSKRQSDRFPDLVIIDGGKGQLSAAREVFDRLGVDIALLAIAKGPERHAGKETFFTPEHPEGFKIDDMQSLLFYLQRLRDEAHRAAILFHRKKRTRAMGASLLDHIPDVGAKRKKILLQHFGSVALVKAASIDDLEKVSGISKNLAKRIYQYLHSR